MGNACNRRRSQEADLSPQEVLEQAGLIAPQPQQPVAKEVDESEPLPEVEPATKLNPLSCHACWKRAGGSICRRCNKVKYCSAQCQKNHWPEHKLFCGKDDGHLRHLWGTMTSELLRKGATGTLTKHRQFMQHVGPKFWYNDKGYNILHILVGISKLSKVCRSQDYVFQQLEAFVQEASSYGADMNARCDTGETPLHLASKDSSAEAQRMLALLLKQPGIDFTVVDNEGNSAEQVAALESSKVLFKERLEADRLAKEEREQKEKEEKKKAAEIYKENLYRRLEATPRRERCRECWKPGRLVCRRCNKVYYCSPECQKTNWEIHNQICGKKLLDLSELFQGTLGVAMESGKVDGLQTFVQHISGDVCIDFQQGLFVAHAVAVLALKLGPALTGAAKTEFQALLQDLIDFNIDVNAQTKTGDTALHMLCTAPNGAGAFMAVWLLETAAVDLQIRNEAELTALECTSVAGMKLDKDIEFSVKLEKASDDKIGLSLDLFIEKNWTSPAELKPEDICGLLVTGITEGGVMTTWNASHPDTAVFTGDVIVEVNGKTKIKDMQEELKGVQGCEVIEFKFQRGYRRMLELLSGARALGSCRVADAAEEDAEAAKAQSAAEEDEATSNAPPDSPDLLGGAGDSTSVN